MLLFLVFCCWCVGVFGVFLFVRLVVLVGFRSGLQRLNTLFESGCNLLMEFLSR